MTEKEIHEKILSFVEGEDLNRFAADTSSSVAFYCLVLENGEIEDRYCTSSYDASDGVYVEVDASAIAEEAREEAVAEGIDAEQAESDAYENIVAEWIDSGQAARDLLAKIEENELRRID